MSAATPLPPPRILLIEDNAERIGLFRAWLPEDAPLVAVGGAGRALGLLRRCRPDRRDRRRGSLEYAGILLDHDLGERVAAEGEEHCSGTQVAAAIVERISVEVPVLIHSMNPRGARAMQERLDRAGFWTTRIPMSALDRERFLAWFGEVRENWRALAEL